MACDSIWQDQPRPHRCIAANSISVVSSDDNRWTFSSRIAIIVVMKLRLIVEKDLGTGRYSSIFPELPGCASAGDTEDEAIANAKEALELWFEPTDISLDDSAKLVEVTV